MKRASGTPWVRIFGKTMRPTDSRGGGGESQGKPTGRRRRTLVQTEGDGEGSLKADECHLFLYKDKNYKADTL